MQSTTTAVIIHENHLSLEQLVAHLRDSKFRQFMRDTVIPEGTSHAFFDITDRKDVLEMVKETCKVCLFSLRSNFH